MSRSSGVWFITRSRRLDDVDGRFAGVMVAPIEVDYLLKLLAGFDIGREGAIGLFSAAATDPTLLAVDSPWTFMLDDEQPHRGTRVWMLLSRPDGVHVRTTSIRPEDLGLRDLIDDLVITTNEEARIPVAILTSLRPATARMLCALCHGRYDVPELVPDELPDNAALYRLCESASAAGALARHLRSWKNPARVAGCEGR